MNWIWIILLLCCCKNNGCDNECGCYNHCDNSCIQPRSERVYPRAPFAPDCDRDCDRDYDRERSREHDCGCRASEVEKDRCDD